MFKKYVSPGVLAIALLLCLTPFYTYGIFIALVFLTIKYPVLFFTFLRPLSTRILVTILFFLAWIMVLGMYGWVAGLDIPALIYLASFLLVYWVLYRNRDPSENINPPYTKTPSYKLSLVSAALAGIAIFVMVASFYLPKPSLASTIQIITNGYDNSAHLSLIRTTYQENGYVYGDYESVKNEVAWRTLTAYPQGWHFGNAFLWKGTALKPFASPNISMELWMYVITLFSWYFAVVFLFNQLIFYVVQLIKPRLRIDIVQLSLITGLSIIIQLLVFWGALTYGFVTFLCALAYLFILAAIIAGDLETPFTKLLARQKTALLLASLLCITAITQGWLFATPIVAVMTILAFLPERGWSSLRALRLKSLVIPMLAFLFIVTPIAVQAAINIQHSPQGSSQINDDGGIFGISTTLAAILSILTVGLVLASRPFTPRQRVLFITIALPALGFTGLLLLYQLISIGHPAYFFTKSLALALCLIWIPLSCAAILFIDKTRQALPAPHLLGAIATGLLVITFMFGQDTTSFKRLLQRESNITTPVAQKLETAAINGSLKQAKVFVLAQERYDGDVIGSIFSLTTGASRSQCVSDVLWVIITRRNEELPPYANKCSPTEDIRVINSPNTSPEILKRLDNSIKVIR